MASKLTAAKIASWSGVRAVIAGADRPGVLRDAVDGAPGVGTVIRPREKRLPARQLWIAFAVGASGTVSVDEGARRALTERNVSLLPAGVVSCTGRFAAGDAVEVLGPDGRVFAKGIANGMPLSAYCGQRDLMQTARRATVSTTYGGETLSLAAAKATIETYLNENVVAHLWQAGQRLWSQVNSLCDKHSLPIRLEGFYPCPAWTFPDPATRERFLRSAYRHGLSLYDVSYVNFSHREQDVADAVQRFRQTIQQLATGR